jgi:hypothetical protein
MGRKARDWIPENILQAAHQAGLTTPLWYIGRTKGTPSRNHKTLQQLAEEGRKKADTDTEDTR